MEIYGIQAVLIGKAAKAGLTGADLSNYRDDVLRAIMAGVDPIPCPLCRAASRVGRLSPPPTDALNTGTVFCRDCGAHFQFVAG